VKWKSAVDWLFCTDLGATSMSTPERRRLYRIVRKMCPLDKELDSPCPRWILNILLCNGLTYRQRLRLVMKHHELLTGQSFGVMTENDVLKVKKGY